MNKIFYWSPYLSNVATIRNVINSALSLKKYNYDSYDVSLLDTMGEWKLYKEEIIQNKVNIKKINNLNLNFDLNKSGYFKSRLYFIFIFIFNFFPLLKLLKVKKPNFLIVHLLTSLPLTLLLFFQFKTKFILRISGLPRLNFIRKLLWRLIGKKIFLVTCPSKETLNHINKLNIFDPQKVTLLYDPIIDVSKIHNNLKKKIDVLDLQKDYFISVGRLTKQKNHTLLIKLFKIMCNKNRNLFLYILGDGEEKINIIKEIKQLKLEDNVILLGYKKNPYPFISKANAVLSPSLWEDPGAVMIEAAFCNKIVISSDCISGPKEFLLDGKGGYLFKNNNLSSFVKTINDFLQDNNHNILLKKINAKKNSKKYTLFNHFKQLDALLC
jgi:glycosyltransferase involved in cell wall biosynthesis|tara:strand:+ start:228 stop:1373 length:1146 start_codon:yes stop_codon:yes gene_type:complete